MKTGRWTKQYLIDFKKIKNENLLACGVSKRDCDTWVCIEDMTLHDRRTWVQNIIKADLKLIELYKEQIKCLRKQK